MANETLPNPLHSDQAKKAQRETMGVGTNKDKVKFDQTLFDLVARANRNPEVYEIRSGKKEVVIRGPNTENPNLKRVLGILTIEDYDTALNEYAKKLIEQ